MTEKQRKELGEKMRAMRAGESREHVSWRCGITHKTIYLIEKGKTRNPRPNTLAKIAIALGEDPNSLLGFLSVHMSSEDINRLR